MKATLLLATLKKNEPSNTEALAEFFIKRLSVIGIECETIKLVNFAILPGTNADMGEGDEWPSIQQKLEASDIILFATPIWWNVHSSEMQKVVERLDNIHDEILAGKPSRLDDKVGGIIITGDSDGAEQLIANLSNFLNAIGILIPPYATLSVLWEGHKKGEIKPKKDLQKYYEDEYGKVADKMAQQLIRYAKLRS
ncbi:MAG: flavodoxin family protein [Bacteroidetes bacterium]|nr:flavodoxin family protein [Bacteroidota bacterium]